MSETERIDVLADLRSVVRIAKAASIGVTGNALRIEKAEAAIVALAELIEAAHEADGDERLGRPEGGIGYTDLEWEQFLRGWDAHADAIYHSGLRKALARVQGGAE